MSELWKFEMIYCTSLVYIDLSVFSLLRSLQILDENFADFAIYRAVQFS